MGIVSRASIKRIPARGFGRCHKILSCYCCPSSAGMNESVLFAGMMLSSWVPFWCVEHFCDATMLYTCTGLLERGG